MYVRERREACMVSHISLGMVAVGSFGGKGGDGSISLGLVSHGHDKGGRTE